MLSIGKQRSEVGFVFTSDVEGSPFHPQRLIQIHARKAKACGLPIVKLHALRHGHATHLLESGVPLKVASERLGHSSISITETSTATSQLQSTKRRPRKSQPRSMANGRAGESS